uniref:Uncharacterized protein n=1 Tax=Oryza punctata TaxID=4537 RepID=A0A0E0JM74_ORYPU
MSCSPLGIALSLKLPVCLERRRSRWPSRLEEICSSQSIAGFCHGSKVSVGESKLCHTVLLLESLITRLPVSRRVTVVCLPEDVLLSHTVVPLVSARTRLPSWPSDTLEP